MILHGNMSATRLYQDLLLGGAALQAEADGRRVCVRRRSGSDYPDRVAQAAAKQAAGLRALMGEADERRQSQRAIRHQVDGRQVVVIDGCLPKTEITCFREHLDGCDYSASERDTADAEQSTEASEFDVDAFRERFDVSVCIAELLSEHFPREAHRAVRCYVNRLRPGDPQSPHRDCRENARDVTALYYANDRWSPEYAGATVFYEADGRVALSVLPVPGRTVLFRGAIVHAGSAPAESCPHPRYTVAMKFRSRPLS